MTAQRCLWLAEFSVYGSVLQRLDKRHHPLLDEMDMIYRCIRL